MSVARRLLATLGVAALAAAAGLGGLYLYSPAQALNMANTLLLGDRAAVHVEDGVAFTPGLKLDVWAPPPARPGPHPVLVFFYGGSWIDGRRQDYGFVGRAYAARGFLVVIPDYRKVPEGRFPGFMEDAAAALRWTHANAARFGGDPDRIALAGHSVGGYIAAMLALDRCWATSAGLPAHAIRAAVGLAGPYDIYPFRWPPARDALGTAPDPLVTQPIRFARRDAPPLWLATGDSDTVVAARNSVALAARQHALGSRGTALRVYPGLGHSGIVMALSAPFRRIAPVLDESVAFLDANMAPAR